MTLTIKNRSTAKRSLLLWLIFLSPVIALATYMVAAHNGVDDVAALKLTATVLAAWWAGTYVFIRFTRWRRLAGPRSLPPG